MFLGEFNNLIILLEPSIVSHCVRDEGSAMNRTDMVPALPDLRALY